MNGAVFDRVVALAEDNQARCLTVVFLLEDIPDGNQVAVQGVSVRNLLCPMGAKWLSLATAT